MAIRGIAAKVAAAKARGGGNWINPGEGELVVLALKDGTKPEFHEGDTFVAEMRVESCKGFPGLKKKDGEDKPAGNQAGSVVSYVQQFTEYPDTAFSNTKTFLLALMGESDETLAEAAIATAKALAAGDAELKKICDPIMEQCAVSAWTADCEFAKSYETLVDRKVNPARGMRLRYSTYEKDTKDSKTTLTLARWETVKQTMEEVKAKRAQLDSGQSAAPPATT